MQNQKGANNRQNCILNSYATVILDTCIPAAGTLEVMPRTSEDVALIVGEAIKVLVETGADAQVVGKFSMEFPARAATAMSTTTTSPELQIEQIIAATVQRTIEAMGHSAQRIRKGATIKRINVTVGGKRTSVSVSNTALDDVVRIKGSTAGARALMQQFMDAAPPGTPSKSEWVDSQLLNFVLLNSAAAQGKQH